MGADDLESSDPVVVDDAGGGSSSSKVRLGSTAYLKLVFHCLKYPQASVTGVLLATQAPSGAAAADAAVTQVGECIDFSVAKERERGRGGIEIEDKRSSMYSFG